MALVIRIALIIGIWSGLVQAAETASHLLTIGYGTLYNSAVADSNMLSGHLLRAEYTFAYQDFGAVIDAQYLDAEHGGGSPFGLAELNYRVLDREWFPEMRVGGSMLYMDSLKQEKLRRNLSLLDPGLGMTCAFRTAWLPEGYGNFSMRYYPKSHALYKSMQIGWNIIPHLGVSFGGLGIRIPDGRFYSSFLFALRTNF